MEEQGMFGDMAYSQQQPTPNPAAAGGYTQEQVDGKLNKSYLLSLLCSLIYDDGPPKDRGL